MRSRPGLPPRISGVTYRAQRMLNNVVVPRSSQVRAHLERRVPEIEDETLGWTPLNGDAEVVSLAPGVADVDGVIVWTGQIAAPEMQDAERLRLVVSEFEQFDNSSDERLVHADIVEL